MKIFAAKYPNRGYPRVSGGLYRYTEPAKMDIIPKVTITGNLRPDGVRSPVAEARILEKIVAKDQNRTCDNLPLIGR